MKHRQINQLDTLQDARPQHRSGPQAITRQSWEPIAQPARRRQRKADPAFKQISRADLEIYEQWIGRLFLDRFTSRQHRNFDIHPDQFERVFDAYLQTLQPEIRAAIERVIA